LLAVAACTSDRDSKPELTPVQARQQPSSADAVKAVLEERNASGGWVIADLDTYDASARALTNAAGAVVISTHYRPAPEHKFPAAHEDVWAAYRWTLQHAEELGGDPRRIAVAGESAGGNLAMHISLRARDEGVQLPVYQLLVYPGINLLGAKVQGLPPTTIIAAEIDPLRSEGEQLAELLKRAGVPVERRQWDGVTHEFFGMAAVVPEAKEAVQFAGQRLRSAFGR